MSRPSSRPKDIASLAVIQMRRDLKMTQAQLAAALDVTLPTVGRWESWSPPRGITLEKLARFAERNGLVMAASDLRWVIDAERGHEYPLSFGVNSGEESQFVFAVLDVLREAEFASLRPRLKRLLSPVFKKLEFMMSEQKRLLMAVEAVSKTKPGGKPKR